MIKCKVSIYKKQGNIKVSNGGISYGLKVVELFAGVGGFRVGLNHIKRFDEKTGLAIENGDWDLYGQTNGNIY